MDEERRSVCSTPSTWNLFLSQACFSFRIFEVRASFSQLLAVVIGAEIRSFAQANHAYTL